MKHDYCAENLTCCIVPLEERHIEFLRQWRNDKDLSRFLKPIPYITPEDENKWYEHYLNDDATIFFAVIDKTSHQLAGTIALYGFSGDECEIGKIIIGNPASRGKGLGYNSLLLAMCIAMRKLTIHKIHLSVHLENLAALTIYVKAGFEICGSHCFIGGGKELEMTITQKRFEVCNPELKFVNIDVVSTRCEETIPSL